MPDSEKIKQTRIRLGRLRQALAENASQVANESDRWFLTTVEYANLGAIKTQAGIGRVFGVLGLDWLTNKVQEARGRTPRERIQKAILREAKRQRLRDKKDLKVFSDQMGTLVELVISGQLRPSDIGFEAQPAPNPVEISVPTQASTPVHWQVNQPGAYASSAGQAFCEPQPRAGSQYSFDRLEEP